MTPTYRDQTRRSNGPIGEPVTIIAVGIAACIAWASATAVTIGAVLGLSAAMSIAIATSLVMAGIAAGTKAVDGLIQELKDNETADAKWANEFDSRQWESQYTSEEATKAFIEALKAKHGRAGELASIKVWARWKIIHEPGPILAAAGIISKPDDVRTLWNLMQLGDTADAQYANDFYSEQWESSYTSNEAVLAFIKGLQERQGTRAGAMCGIKVWARWNMIVLPKLMEAETARTTTLSQSVARSSLTLATFQKLLPPAPSPKLALQAARGFALSQAVAKPYIPDAEDLRRAKALDVATGAPAPSILQSKPVKVGGGIALASAAFWLLRKVL